MCISSNVPQENWSLALSDVLGFFAKALTHSVFFAFTMPAATAAAAAEDQVLKISFI